MKSRTGQQDGVWVAATDWMIGGTGSGYNPGRKWGEFSTEQNARLWALGELLTKKDILPSAAIKTIEAHIDGIRQYKLF